MKIIKRLIILSVGLPCLVCYVYAQASTSQYTAASWNYVENKSTYDIQGVPPIHNSANEIYTLRAKPSISCVVDYVFAGPRLTNGMMALSYTVNGTSYKSVPNFVAIGINAKFFPKGGLGAVCAKYYTSPPTSY